MIFIFTFSDKVPEITGEKYSTKNEKGNYSAYTRDDSWGVWSHKQYLITPSLESYEYGFTIIPFDSAEEIINITDKRLDMRDFD